MRIKTPSRIHITLIDLNGSIGRIDGGVGLALESPFIEILARENDRVLIRGKAENIDRFYAIANKFSKLTGRGIEIEVLSDYKPHIGLGSGTQISLAIGKSFNDLYNLGLSIRDIAKIAGRGGTSGIGISAFEFGGFIVDAGHSKKYKRSFLPSSFSKAPPPPLIARYDFPEWDICLIIPNKSGFYGNEELNLFERNTPLPIEEVRELSHIILMKLMPSVIEQDLDEFSQAIFRIQEIGFKRAEVEQYGEKMKNLLSSLSEVGACGMSSTGPTVYVISEKIKMSDVRSIVRECDIRAEILKTKANNRGAEVEV